EGDVFMWCFAHNLSSLKTLHVRYPRCRTSSRAAPLGRLCPSSTSHGAASRGRRPLTKSLPRTGCFARDQGRLLGLSHISDPTMSRQKPGTIPTPIEGFAMAHFSAAEVISLLNLKPHPEGGHFRETFR